jgi:hydrogenase maturation factor
MTKVCKQCHDRIARSWSSSDVSAVAGVTAGAQEQYEQGLVVGAAMLGIVERSSSIC